MIYMAFALYWEAQPFIEYLKLKRDADFEKVQLFKGSAEPGMTDIVLFLTGPGAINGAAAAAYICGQFPPSPGDLFVNFGICAGAETVCRGNIYRVHSIFEAATGRWFYPDMLLGAGDYPQEGLMTSPVEVKTMKDQPCSLADMEASGVYQAAQMFFEQHQILFFKVVYDQPDKDGQGGGPNSLPEPENLPCSPADKTAGPHSVSPGEEVKKLCGSGAEKLMKALFNAAADLEKLCPKKAVFSPQEIQAQEHVARCLRATVAMRKKLGQILYYEKLCGKDLVAFLRDFCETYPVEACGSKKDGMKWLEALEERSWK